MTPDELIDAIGLGWSLSKPEGFVDFFQPRSHPEVIATQPILPTATGPEAYMRAFRNTFRLLRNVTLEIRSTGTEGDTVFLISTLRATIGGRKMALEVADRFILRDGLIWRRESYFDPTPILVGVLLRPWTAPAAIRCLRG